MIIPIDDTTRVRGTEACWQLERLKIVQKGKAAGEEVWEPLKYCKSVEHALSEALQREIRLHPAQTIIGAVEAAQRLTAKYAAIFDGVPK